MLIERGRESKINGQCANIYSKLIITVGQHGRQRVIYGKIEDVGL